MCIKELFCCFSRYTWVQHTHIAELHMFRRSIKVVKSFCHRIPLSKMRHLLKEININDKYIRTIWKIRVRDRRVTWKSRKLYLKTSYAQKICDEDVVFPPPCSKYRYIEFLKNVKENGKWWQIEVDGQFLHTLLFADDEMKMTCDIWWQKLTEAYGKWGLKINFAQTKHKVAGEKGRDLEVGGNVTESCKEYNYLRVAII